VKTDHVIALAGSVTEKADRLITRELRARAIRGLAPSHGAILFELYRSEEISMKEISKRISRDKSTVTALIKKLEALGYVEKINDRQDGRVTLVRLTKKGLELKPAFDRISEALLKRAYLGFSTKERERLVTLLEKVLRNL
jgi:DNA-binding MarR family transcriptional regulator